LAHLRIARGERLSADEQAFYESLCTEFDRDETTFTGQGKRLREALETVKSLETEHSALEERRRQVESQIIALESMLGAQTHQPSQTQGWLLVAKQRFLEEENVQLRRLLAAQDRYIVELKRLLGLLPDSAANE
jgi:predicted RNase H-like nuclease (RuvC/YqgF family)